MATDDMEKARFTERAPHERGFAAYHAERIAPVLDRLAVQGRETRRKGLRRAGWTLAVGALPVAAAAWFGLAEGGPGWWLPAFAAGVVAFLAVMVLAAHSQSHDAAAQDAVLPLLVEFAARDYDTLRYVDIPAKDFIEVERLARLKLFSGQRYETHAFRRGIEATVDGVPVRMAHVSVRARRQKDERHSDILFSGPVAAVATPPESWGRMPLTVFHTDREKHGVFGKAFAEFVHPRAGGLEKLDFPDPEVEAVYDVYSADPAAARAHLDPGFGRALLDVARDATGTPRRLVAAFLERTFTVALPGADGFLDFRTFGKDAVGVEEALHAALDDLTLPRRLVARLTGAPPQDRPAA